MDAPFHFVLGGQTIDSLPLEHFIGPALMCSVDASSHITGKHVADIDLVRMTRVLFKTRNSRLLHQKEYAPDFTAFSVETAESLAQRGVWLMGLDYLSVALTGQCTGPSWISAWRFWRALTCW